MTFTEANIKLQVFLTDAIRSGLIDERQGGELLKPFKDLEKEYAKPVNLENITMELIQQLRETEGIGLGIVDYRGDEPQVLFSNECKYVEAYQHPELMVEVENETKNQ